jgi:hypothetical protein
MRHTARRRALGVRCSPTRLLDKARRTRIATQPRCPCAVPLVRQLQLRAPLRHYGVVRPSSSCPSLGSGIAIVPGRLPIPGNADLTRFQGFLLRPYVDNAVARCPKTQLCCLGAEPEPEPRRHVTRLQSLSFSKQANVRIGSHVVSCDIHVCPARNDGVLRISRPPIKSQ